ncbi:MAG: hypothetical protein RLZZ196_2690 [Bacteroidota bacterium]|jgi:hypothetical protein
MDQVKINTNKTLTLTLPSDPTSNAVSVSLYHEFGDLVSGPTAATRVSSGVYTITYGQQNSGEYILNSAGLYRAEFSFSISGTSYTRSQTFFVYTPYATSADFFTLYPELQESFGSIFDIHEKRIRNVINTYCGQNFYYYPDKTLILDGNNHENLHLPIPILSIKKVTINPGDDDQEILHDVTDPTLNNIEKVRQPLNFQASYYIRYTNKSARRDYDAYDYRNDRLYPARKFHPKSDFKIEGDFGWEYVPENVNQAAILLLADSMNDDSEYRRHGIHSMDMDVVKIQTKDSFYESTGNIDADVLLMDYTLFVMDYVV